MLSFSCHIPIRLLCKDGLCRKMEAGVRAASLRGLASRQWPGFIIPYMSAETALLTQAWLAPCERRLVRSRAESSGGLCRKVEAGVRAASLRGLASRQWPGFIIPYMSAETALLTQAWLAPCERRLVRSRAESSGGLCRKVEAGVRAASLRGLASRQWPGFIDLYMSDDLALLTRARSVHYRTRQTELPFSLPDILGGPTHTSDWRHGAIRKRTNSAGANSGATLPSCDQAACHGPVHRYPCGMDPGDQRGTIELLCLSHWIGVTVWHPHA
ncbi:hypothetical protein DFJ77DRAFT_97416 [Powellomyces hirtus]|nr:hypothetical protein DFJ77DRAFT_97416 [Powellomyces hirtus]